MKSLATITENDIDTIKIALNDSISDINQELNGDVKPKKRVELSNYKDKYLKVYNKLRQNPSIYICQTLRFEFFTNMRCYPNNIVHKLYRLCKDIMIYPLEYITAFFAIQIAVNAKSVINMTATVGYRVQKSWFSLEIAEYFTQIVFYHH